MNRCLFLDMNAYYASVEQQERPELRGKPVIIAPMVDTDATCAIACSYEAKRWGITTGTGIRQARKLCEWVRVIEARPELYLQYHQRIVDILNRHCVRVRPLSIDEMVGTVSRLHPTREEEMRLAQRIKADMRQELGAYLTASIGIAQNVFLSKVASDRQKPDGLTVWRQSDLPDALFRLELMDLPGIGSQMLLRLHRHGITTVRQLWEAERHELRAVWGSVIGARWWYMLRGSQEADYGMYLGQTRKSVGHSHVLPPEYRTQEGAEEILMRLFSRAIVRLRSYHQIAASLEIRLDYRHKFKYTYSSWRKRSGKHIHCADEATWVKVMRKLLADMPPPQYPNEPYRASVTFSNLILEQDKNLTLDLFPEENAKRQLGAVRDALNAKGHSVELGNTFWLQEQAPKRIAYGPPQ